MLLNPIIWVPHFYFILQTISIMYPISPNDVSKKKYYEFISNIPVYFPHFPLGKNFTKLLNEYPISPYLKTRESFMRWVNFIINKINISMKWNQITFYDSLEDYYNNYKPQEVIKREKLKKRKQYIQIFIVFLFIFSIIYLFKKNKIQHD